MSQSPVRALVPQTLQRIEKKAGIVDTSELYLELFDAAAGIGAEAVAGCGVGLDHFAGERVLAAIMLRDTPKGNEHRLACAITDQRTMLSGWSSISGPLTFNNKRGAMSHAELTGVDVKDSMLKVMVTLMAGGTKMELPFGQAVKRLGAFYRGLGQIPAAHRVPPPTRFVEPGPDDPAGARQAASDLWFDDPAARSLLLRVAERAEADEMDEATGRDFVSRVVLAHRSRGGGPGMAEERWITPMTAQDLGHTLVRIYGTPVQHAQPQPGVEQLDFVSIRAAMCWELPSPRSGSPATSALAWASSPVRFWRTH